MARNRSARTAVLLLAVACVPLACSRGGSPRSKGPRTPNLTTTTTAAPTTTTSSTTGPAPTGSTRPTATSRRTTTTTRTPTRCGGAPLVEAPSGTVVQVRRCGEDSADYTFGFRVGDFATDEACRKGIAAVRDAGFRITRDTCDRGTASFGGSGLVGNVDTTIPNGTIRIGWIRRG